MWETQAQSLGWEDPLEEDMATHSSVLAWETADRGAWLAGCSPWGLKRVGYDLATVHARTVGYCITAFETDEGDYIISIEENVFKNEKSRFQNSVDTKKKKSQHIIQKYILKIKPFSVT